MAMKSALVADLLERQAEQIPDKTALIYKKSEWTYSSLNAQANRVAYWLKERGMKSGDRVVLYGRNSDKLVASIFGIVKAGGAFVPVNPETALSKLKYIIKDCQPHGIIIDGELFDMKEFSLIDFPKAVLLTSETIRNEATNNPLITIWEDLNRYSEKGLDLNVSPDDLAAIIYTSGSSKDPKGVVEPNRQVTFAVSAINKVLKNTQEDTILCGLPISFDYGLYQIFLAFQVGAKLVLEQDFSLPMIIPRMLKLHKITGFPGVPSLFAMLLRTRLLENIELPDLRYITSTGDVFPPAYIKKLKNLLPCTTVYPMYGLTECKRVSIMPEGFQKERETSVGLPLPGTRVSIVDQSGNELPYGATGELIVKGGHVMKGYWNNEADTLLKFRYDNKTQEPVLYTGDLFRMDADGFLYFVGRNEMFIKSRGQKVSPSEVEGFLCSLEYVSEAAVVGVEDDIDGEKVCACVCVTNINNTSKEDILQKCREGLPVAACPKDIKIMDGYLPKTANGKIDRKEVRKILTGTAAVKGND